MLASRGKTAMKNQYFNNNNNNKNKQKTHIKYHSIYTYIIYVVNGVINICCFRKILLKLSMSA